MERIVRNVQTGEVAVVAFTPDEVNAIKEAAPALSASLSTLTARQLRLCLVINGLQLDHVQAAIDSIDNDQARAMAEVEWKHAAIFERDHPLIEQVGVALQLSSEDIDSLWQQASSL